MSCHGLSYTSLHYNFVIFCSSPLCSASNWTKAPIALSPYSANSYLIHAYPIASHLTYKGDMATITYLILLVYRLFPSADYRWLTNEMNTNLPLELDFKVEVGRLSDTQFFVL